MKTKEHDAGSNSSLSRRLRAHRTLSLGKGKIVPYPEPSSKSATSVMKGNRRRDTGPERAVRSLLHRAGLRYRVDVAIVGDRYRVRPDVVFRASKVAVFVDGCFWHGCP